MLLMEQNMPMQIVFLCLSNKSPFYFSDLLFVSMKEISYMPHTFENSLV